MEEKTISFVAKISKNGRIVIPATIREIVGLKEGDHIRVVDWVKM